MRLFLPDEPAPIEDAELRTVERLSALGGKNPARALLFYERQV